MANWIILLSHKLFLKTDSLPQNNHSVSEQLGVHIFNQFFLQILVASFYPPQIPQEQVIAPVSGYLTLFNELTFTGPTFITKVVLLPLYI